MMADLIRPTDLLQMASDAELAEMDKERLLKTKKQQQDLDLRESFMKRKVAPEAIDRINHAVSVAAKRGEHQRKQCALQRGPCLDADNDKNQDRSGR